MNYKPNPLYPFWGLRLDLETPKNRFGNLTRRPKPQLNHIEPTSQNLVPGFNKIVSFKIALRNQFEPDLIQPIFLPLQSISFFMLLLFYRFFYSTWSQLPSRPYWVPPGKVFTRVRLTKTRFN